MWRIDKEVKGLVANDSGLVINGLKLVVSEDNLTVKLVVNGKKLTVKVGSNYEMLVIKLQKLVLRAERLTVNRLEILKMLLKTQQSQR